MPPLLTTTQDSFPAGGQPLPDGAVYPQGLVEEFQLAHPLLLGLSWRHTKARTEFAKLLTIPGVGKTLAVTILLEVGDIKRFPGAGDYVSYCRQVKSKRTSNNKNKGSNNEKNGNAYLSWVYMEAACKAARYSDRARTYFNKKLKARHIMVAYKSLAAKIARASYYIMKNNVDYNEDLIFPKP